MLIGALARGERGRFATSWGFLIAAQLAGLLAQMASILLIARALGPAGLGQFSYLSLVILVGWTFVEFGLDNKLIRDFAGNPSLAGKLLSETVLARLPLALLTVAALWILPLPRVSGTLVYEDLRSRKTTRSTPVIILSRDQLPRFPDEYVTVLRQPLETNALVAAVAAALGKTPSPPVA